MDLENHASTSEKPQGKPNLGLPHAGSSPAPADLLTRHTIALAFHWYIPETGAAKPGDVSDKRRLLDKLAMQFQALGLTGQDPAQNFILHLYRRNCRKNTLESYGGALCLFFGFLRDRGKSQIEALTREDLEAFVEHEQDRGLKPLTVKTRLSLVKAFARYLINQEVVRAEVLSRSLMIKVPELLPKAMDPEDVKKLLLVVHHIRNRAMILLLLRTGMRIGELLQTTVNDLNLRERKIVILQAEKTQVGRVVYFSDDAREALLAWLAERLSSQPKLFYAQGRDSISYTAVRTQFQKYLAQAGLSQKGYSLHSLRHTFATELLNAGMRLECLQQLLGHTNLEVTRRYARLTDKTREQEYFRAMAIIERGQVNGSYQRDRQFPAFSQETQLFAAHR
jgi:integrase/recombinase XerD